jgi:acetoacetyl-CoA synthetase
VINSKHDTNQPLWEPSAKRREQSRMFEFLTWTFDQKKIASKTWDDLYRWSIHDLSDFWYSLSQFLDLKFQNPPKTIFTPGPTFKDATWFQGATLNVAQNILPTPDDREVLVAIAEGTKRATWTGKDLWNDVARCASGLKKLGIVPGDRVAGVLINGPEAIICMLATASLGAIWSSCSPDFGARGIADRLLQIEPKVVFATTRYYYNGKLIDCKAQIQEALKGATNSIAFIDVDHLSRGSDAFSEFLNASHAKSSIQEILPIEFVPRLFQDPQFILFSSGTTGLPKCIVHGVGGTLLQHKKELALHSDIKQGDTLFYFTTCGWMMWNWMASALSCGARIITFDGSPTFPDTSNLWTICRDESVTHFGTSPKFLSACMQSATLDLNSIFAKESVLRTLLSTGSPLLPQHFEWVYEQFEDIHLASISGGTDIVSCFMLGNPLLPVYVSEIQAPGLGMAIQGWNSDCKAVFTERSELVCVKPFVSMPVCFWNDADGARYHNAYFSYYPNHDVWRHGDFVEFTDVGGIIVYGRSDATLNPGGVRIGTAELYRAVETLSYVSDSLAIGHEWNGDTIIILFVKLSRDTSWNDDIQKSIKACIRRELTPRHVPAFIFPVDDIPYTRSGKKVELAATQAFQGLPVPNREALSNPDSLLDCSTWRSHLK